MLIIFRVESKGISFILLNIAPSFEISKPFFTAASKSAFSVGSPVTAVFERFFCTSQFVQSAAYFKISLHSKLSGENTPPRGSLISVTVILFSVRVPVLSEHIKVALPSVSQLGRWRIIAPRDASFPTPRESTMVTIAGSPSGIAATARLTASIKLERISFFLIIPRTNITAQHKSAPAPRAFESFESRF